MSHHTKNAQLVKMREVVQAYVQRGLPNLVLICAPAIAKLWKQVCDEYAVIIANATCTSWGCLTSSTHPFVQPSNVSDTWEPTTKWRKLCTEGVFLIVDNDQHRSTSRAEAQHENDSFVALASTIREPSFIVLLSSDEKETSEDAPPPPLLLQLEEEYGEEYMYYYQPERDQDEKEGRIQIIVGMGDEGDDDSIAPQPNKKKKKMTQSVVLRDGRLAAAALSGPIANQARLFTRVQTGLHSEEAQNVM